MVCSTSLVIRGMQMKTSSIDFGKIFYLLISSVGNMYGRIVLSHTTALKSSWTTSIKMFNCFFSFCPAISCPKYLSWHVQTHAQRYMCIYEMLINETEKLCVFRIKHHLTLNTCSSFEHFRGGCTYLY